MHVRFIQFTESETQNYPSVNNYCSAALTIDVVTKEREKVSHTRQRCVSQEEVSRGQNSCGRDHVQLMQTRWIQKRSLFTTNVKAVGDTRVTAAHGARVCAISLNNQNQQRQEVCFSMSGDALTLRSDMSKNQVFACMQV